MIGVAKHRVNHGIEEIEPPSDGVFFPTEEPTNPVIGEYYYASISNPKWWDGEEWRGM